GVASAGVVDGVAWEPTAGASRILSASVATDAFVPSDVSMSPGAGPVPVGQFQSNEAGRRFVFNNRQLIGSARLIDGTWSTWDTPCAAGTDGATAADPAMVA